MARVVRTCACVRLGEGAALKGGGKQGVGACERDDIPPTAATESGSRVNEERGRTRRRRE